MARSKRTFPCHIFYGLHESACTCKPLIGAPHRRRPTDTERLDALLRWLRQARPISDYWTRPKIDRQLREEAKRAKGA